MVSATDACGVAPASPVKNSASKTTSAARPRTRIDSPPGGCRPPRVVSSRSASVTSRSPTQAPSVAVGITRPAHVGPLRVLGLGARFAGFVDEGAIFGGTRGFIGGLTLTARSGRSTLAELGDPTNLTTFGVDLTVEATGYLAANSPLAVGSSWAAVTVLPGLRFG